MTSKEARGIRIVKSLLWKTTSSAEDGFRKQDLPVSVRMSVQILRRYAGQ